MDNLLFYDIEVFEKDALVVFMDINGEEVNHFWNERGRTKAEQPSGFEGVRELIKGKTLVGYNNYNYDDRILTAMMDEVKSLPRTLHAISNSAINGTYFTILDPDITSLDTMQQISVAHPSLKQIEGNMGMSIVESPISFNIGRALTDEEREQVLFYCRHDVRATIEIYKIREKSYFEVKEGLVSMIPKDELSDMSYRLNTTTLSASALLGKKKSDVWFSRQVPKHLWRMPIIPEEVWKMWEEMTTEDGVFSKGKSKTIKAFDCNFVFGLGGLHGAPSKPIRCSNVKHLDVSSMYPSSIVTLNALGEATEKYDGMRKERISIKHSDPVRAAALKLILNSVYGNFKNEHSALYNPMASATVCIYGQIALFCLCQRLHDAGYRIVNANTDGVVYYEGRSGLGDRDMEIARQWEKDFPGYELEDDEYDVWIQKDVNNYIAVEADGKVTVKGGDVNKYQLDHYFSNNNIRIVQIAMVEHLLHGNPTNTDIIETLTANTDKPLLWQYILKAGSTFLGVQDESGEWQNNVNRVFAAKEGLSGCTKLYKIRKDGAKVNFPDVPDRMYIWNEGVNEIPDFENIVDIGYYFGLVVDKLKGWPA